MLQAEWKHYFSIELISVSVSEINNAQKWPDKTEMFLLKLAADFIAAPLSHIFSLTSNKIPKICKPAFVLPS